MNPHSLNSPAWNFYCYASFAVATATTLVGVWMMEEPLTMKGFFVMGLFFSIGSAFTLAKTLRDEHEAKQWRHRVEDAKTERLLRDVEAA